MAQDDSARTERQPQKTSSFCTSFSEASWRASRRRPSRTSRSSTSSASSRTMRAAHAAWKARAQPTVDNAHMRYFIVHLHRLLDPRGA